jgi:hypothetical protein
VTKRQSSALLKDETRRTEAEKQKSIPPQSVLSNEGKIRSQTN